MTVKLKAEQQLWNRRRECFELTGHIAQSRSTREVEGADGTKIRQTLTASRLIPPRSAASPEATSQMREGYKPPETP